MMNEADVNRARTSEAVFAASAVIDGSKSTTAVSRVLSTQDTSFHDSVKTIPEKSPQRRVRILGHTMATMRSWSVVTFSRAAAEGEEAYREPRSKTAGVEWNKLNNF